MALPAYAVTFRGRPACPCQVEWLPAYESEAQRRGFLKGPLPISQLIGGAPESGGVHTKGGFADFDDAPGVILDIHGMVWLARQMGADATWFRPDEWDGDDDEDQHIHSGLRGCPHNGPGRYQITAVDDGFNGLGHLGHGARDDGPRPLSGRSWQQGIAWAIEQEENDVTPDDIDKIAAEAAEKLLAAKVPGGSANLTVLEVLTRIGKYLDKNGKPKP